MFPRAVKIVQNFQWIFQDFYAPVIYTRLLHETAVIMGDDIPTAGEIAEARAKALAITNNTQATTLGGGTRGRHLSPFQHACLLYGGYSYGPL